MQDPELPSYPDPAADPEGGGRGSESPGSSGGSNFLARMWEKVLAEPLRRVEEESRAHMSEDASRRLDRKVVVVLVTAAVSLTLLEYVGMSNEYRRLVWLLESIGLDDVGAAVRDALTVSEQARINRLTYWMLGCLTSYFLIPALVIRLVLGERIADYGLRLGGALRDAWIYVFMFGVVLPLVIVVSGDAHFQETYPFYELRPDESLWPNLWRWELLYAVQFFALEFFFRGFMVHGTRHRFGWYAVFVMMVPYCMIHFGKPMPETFGAIIAGIVLGSLSLKTRSIWLGVAIHASVALSMDFAALWRKGLIP